MPVSTPFFSDDVVSKRLSWGTTSYSDAVTDSRDVNTSRSHGAIYGILRNKPSQKIDFAKSITSIKQPNNALNLSGVENLKTGHNEHINCPDSDSFAAYEVADRMIYRQSFAESTLPFFSETIPASKIMRCDASHSFPPRRERRHEASMRSRSPGNEISSEPLLQASKSKTSPAAIAVDTAAMYRDFLRRIESGPPPAVSASIVLIPTSSPHGIAPADRILFARTRRSRRWPRPSRPATRAGCLGFAWPLFGRGRG